MSEFFSDILIFSALILVSILLCLIVEKSLGIKVKKIKMPGIGRVFIFFGVFGVMMTLQYIQQVYQFDFLLNSILIIFSISIVLSLIDFIFIKEGKTYIRNLLFGVIYVLTTIPILILL